MKKLFIFMLFLLCTTISAQETGKTKGHVFVGGSSELSYTSMFNMSLEPIVGYEFNDRWALGTGLGMTLAADGGDAYIVGVFEPFVRFTAWHNDITYIDIKTVSSLGFNDQLIMMQVGLRPSLRFRITRHFDLAADIGLLGAYWQYGDWFPAIGLSGVSAGLWFAYRF